MLAVHDFTSRKIVLNRNGKYREEALLRLISELMSERLYDDEKRRLHGKTRETYFCFPFRGVYDETSHDINCSSRIFIRDHWCALIVARLNSLDLINRVKSPSDDLDYQHAD